MYSIFSKNKTGLSLVEVMAILLLLGFLLAFISLNYSSRLSEASNSAAMQAVAEAKARLHHHYTLMLFSKDPDAHKLDAIVAGVSTDAGDYKLIFTISENQAEVDVKAIGVRNGASGQATGRWSLSGDES